MTTKTTSIAKVPLDETDKAILACLIEDARSSIADIARSIGVQRDTVSYRIERMEKRKLISEYHVVLEPHALGCEVFMQVRIKLAPVPKSEADTFLTGLIAHPHVTHITRLVGKYDYHLDVAAGDIVAFDTALDDIKSITPGIIADIEVSSIIDTQKTDDFSGVVANL